MLACFIFSAVCFAGQNESVAFTRADDAEIIQFEQKLAYFFHTSNPELVMQYYTTAITEFEKLGLSAPLKQLQAKVIPPLKSAYQEIARQTGLKFDVKKAGELEFKIIHQQATQAGHEEMTATMEEIYTLVFGKNSMNIKKASKLRTFLYEYKVEAFKEGKQLDHGDMALMLAISDRSKALLDTEFEQASRK